MLLCLVSILGVVVLAFVASVLGVTIDNLGDKCIELIDRSRK